MSKIIVEFSFDGSDGADFVKAYQVAKWVKRNSSYSTKEALGFIRRFDIGAEQELSRFGRILLDYMDECREYQDKNK